MKISFGKALLVFAAILFVAGLGWGLTRAKNKGEASERLGKAAKGDLVQRVTIAGTVVPKRRLVVTPAFNGYVQDVFVTLGQKVKRGEPLTRIVQTLDINEGAHPVRAPFDGVITRVNRSAGESVKANEAKDFVVQLDDTTQLFVEAIAPEIDVVKLKTGQEAVIKANAILTRAYQGLVKSVSLAAKIDDNNWSRSKQSDFPISVEIKDKDEQVKPGMSALIDIVTQKKENVLLLPQEFVNQEGEDYFVILKNGDRRAIKVGERNDESFEIVEGLKEGDEVKPVDFLSFVEMEK